MQRLVAKKRLMNQKSFAEKRLKELVFEVIGEYGKSNVRFSRRAEYLKQAGKSKLLMSAWSLRWARWCLRLQHELIHSVISSNGMALPMNKLSQQSMIDVNNSIKCRLLLPESDAEEISRLKRKLKRLDSSNRLDKLDLLSVIKIEKVGTAQNNLKVPPEVPQSGVKGDASGLLIAKSVTELNGFLEVLTNWARKFVLGNVSNLLRGCGSAPTKPRTSSAAMRDPYNIRNKEALKSFLSSSHIAWMHPSSYYFHLSDNFLLQQYFGGESMYLSCQFMPSSLLLLLLLLLRPSGGFRRGRQQTAKDGQSDSSILRTALLHRFQRQHLHMFRGTLGGPLRAVRSHSRREGEEELSEERPIGFIYPFNRRHLRSL